jgi:hypothetical protein
MSAYTIEGYLVAVRVREDTRTILVEGPSDRILVERVLADLDCHGRAQRANFAVDTTGLIGAAGGQGARALIEDIHERLPDLRNRFAGIVDREFRSFKLAPGIEDEAPAHQVYNESLFWTRGHSVENYFFHIDAILVYLRLRHARLVSQILVDALQDRLPVLLHWAAALSVGAAEAHVVERFSGVVGPDAWTEGGASIDMTGLAGTLRHRGATTDQIQTFGAAVDRVRAFLIHEEEGEVTRWLSHGHIGTQVVWSGVADLARQHGATLGEVVRIARGDTELKLQCAAEYWERLCDASPSADSPDGRFPLLNWLTRK